MGELLSLMCFAVDFDDESCVATVEVSDVWAERVLGSEREIGDLVVTQVRPEEMLGWGEVFTKFFGALLCVWSWLRALAVGCVVDHGWRILDYG